MLRTAFLLLGTALLVVLLWRLGLSEIVDLTRRIGWTSIPILFVYFAHLALRALALRSCVLQPGRLGYLDALAIRLSGEAVQSLTFTGPLMAEPTRAWLLVRRGLTLEEGFAAVITEYLVGTFVTAAMVIVALAYLVWRFEPVPAVSGIVIGVMSAAAAFLIVSAIAIVRRFYLIGTVIKGLARLGLLRGRLRPDMARVNRTEDLLLAILRDRPARVMAIAAIEAVAQALLVVELSWLLHAMDLAVPSAYPFVIEGSIKVVGVVFLYVPMQVGVSEGAYALVFGVMGLPATAGFALAFLRRGRSLAAAGVGLTTLALLTTGRRAR